MPCRPHGDGHMCFLRHSRCFRSLLFISSVFPLFAVASFVINPAQWKAFQKVNDMRTLAKSKLIQTDPATNAKGAEIEAVVKKVEQAGGWDFAGLHTRSSLFKIFNFTAFKHVKWNNWNMGCNDLAIAAPYFRAISDRLYKRKARKRKLLIFDIGANNGQDAANVFGSFHYIQGMCQGFNVPYHLISVEPSPKVFCELLDVAKKKNCLGTYPYHFLNIAVSDSTGNLKFSDPGNEGGKLVISSSDVQKKLVKMTTGEFEKAQRCIQAANLTAVKRRKADKRRLVVVPTYTMDLLISSLVNLRVVSALDDVFILKIDTEGHDGQVMKGSRSLLDEKRITFVLFELSTNKRIKDIAEFMASKGYMCFLFTPQQLVPVDNKDWWYANLEDDLNWWGNGICGVRRSDSLAMFWRMYHSDNLDMVHAFELL